MNFPTEKQDTLSLQNDIKANLGNLFASFAIGCKDGVTTPYLKIGTKALVSKTDDMIRLISEVLLNSKIDDTTEMNNILSQAKSHMEDMIISSGESLALSRIQAGLNEAGAVSEYLAGYEAYRIISSIHKDKDAIAALTDEVAALLKKMVDRRRLTISLAGEVDDEVISKLISIFPTGANAPIRQTTPPCATSSEYFIVPSKVAYATLGGAKETVTKNLGRMRVARSILSYEYLWNTVRVQNGAYGTGFVPKSNGSLSFYSYRDPSPANSLGFYRESANYLRALANENIDITKFIIGAIGEYDTLITPRTATAIATADYLNGWSAEKEAEVRSQMLSMTAEDLLIVADIIDEVLSDAFTTVVGGAEHLDSLTEKPEKIIKI